MRIAKDLVPLKAVAHDLNVSLATLWRARRAGISGFPAPVVIRRMIFWKKSELERLEDALLKFDGRPRFEARRAHARRIAALSKAHPAATRARRPRRKDERQQDLF